MSKGMRWLAFAAAVGATGVEVFCVYDGLKATGGAPLVAGVGIAVFAPLLLAFIEGGWRFLGTVAFVFALACIIVASGSRVGGAIDRAEGQREQATRASSVAKDTEREIKELLDAAKATAKTACANGKERTKTCRDDTARVDTLLGKWTAAGTTLTAAPVAAGEGDVARVSAWLGGYLSERQVRLYLPLLWPVTMALVSAVFWGVWDSSRPARTAPAVTPPIPAPMPAPVEVKPPIAETDEPEPDLAALDVLIDIVRPADARKRVEIEDIHRAYSDACKARGIDVASDQVFSEQAMAFAKAGKIHMLASNDKVYWCGVKLLA
jgi:hypothetical protein